MNDGSAAPFAVGSISAAGAETGEIEPSLRQRAVRIYFGTHTGNCEELAGRLAATFGENGIDAPLSDLDRFGAEKHGRNTVAIIVTSSFGDGEAPFNAEAFSDLIFGDASPRLDGVGYAVLALGDRSYPTFCGFGRAVDSRLAQLGAERLLARHDCDKDFETGYAAWSSRLMSVLRDRKSPIPAGGLAGRPATAGSAPKLSVVEQPSAAAHAFAVVTQNVRLNSIRSTKMVAHLEVHVPPALAPFEPGDSILVRPINDVAGVDRLLATVSLSGDERVAVGQAETSLRHALLVACDIGAYGGRAVARAIFGSASDDRDGACAADVIERAGLDLDPQSLIDMLPPLRGRAYSIASSPLVKRDAIDLCVSRLEYETEGRRYLGVASGYLCLNAAVGCFLRASVQANPRFRLPEDGRTPVIMIGSGTGVAPFRAFLQHRRALGARGPAWLFFGDRHRAHDSLYCEELEGFVADGTLSELSLAFSRDGAEKRYVQHRMRERADEIRNWIGRGAHLYVCGTSHMARDVHAALADIVSVDLRTGRESAELLLRNLVRERRYCRDVY